MRISDGGGCNPGLFYYEYYYLFMFIYSLRYSFHCNKSVSIGKSIYSDMSVSAGCVWFDVIG